MDEIALLVRSLAGCLKDGEATDEGGEFVMENDDAVDTLHSFISLARGCVRLLPPIRLVQIEP